MLSDESKAEKQHKQGRRVEEFGEEEYCSDGLGQAFSFIHKDIQGELASKAVKER